MGIREQIAKHIPDKFKPPLEASTFDEFTDLVAAQGASRVSATTLRSEKDIELGYTRRVQVEFSVGLDTVGKSGRKLQFRHVCGSAEYVKPPTVTSGAAVLSVMSGVVMGGENQNDNIVRTFLTAKQMLDRIQEKLQGVTGVLTQGDGEPFTFEDYRELELEASRSLLKPWD